MKKTLLAVALASTMGVATTADAAFTGTDGAYTMTVTSGCFFFGDCQVGGTGDSADNTNVTDALYGWSGNSYAPGGSGIINDGLVGVIDFTLTNGEMTVTSFSQDSYLATAGGTFFLSGADTTGMGGTINADGTMEFDPTGRMGLAANVSSNELVWNFADSTNVQGTSPDATSTFVTGTQTAFCKTGTTCRNLLSKTGSILVDNGNGGWDGTLVSVANVGDAWGGGFTGIAYSEVFNVTIEASAVPVPAAAWLFGSGLLGLVGIARRKKQA